jgi:hypothetical protein
MEGIMILTELQKIQRNWPVKEIVIGRSYHLSWAKKRGMVWILTSVNQTTGQITLKTPKTGKLLKSKIDDLRNVNEFLGT